MPSPFPGMDPYLEGSLWTSFHYSLAAEIVRQLAPKVQPRYLVLPVEYQVIESEPVPHVSLEIRDAANRELVTAIEILSPTNKRGQPHQKYLAKRDRILSSTAHLLEIDLLRAGQRVPMRDRLPPAAYYVFLSRADDRPMTEVWPIALGQSLPTIPVPLRSPDPDVALGLQLAFTSVYDLVRYDLAIDYTQPPEPPLKGEFAKWAEERIMRFQAHGTSR